MRDQILRTRSFGRRALFTTGAKLFLLSTLLMRLYYLQINQSEKFKTLSDDNRIRLEPIIPKRGKLFDRYGQIIAENKKHYKVMFDPVKAEKPQEILDKVSQILKMSPEKYTVISAKLKDRPKEIQTIGEHVDWEAVSNIEVNNTDLPGVEVQAIQVRDYPLAEAGVHFIGYVSAPTEAEAEKAPVLKTADFKVGRSGIEKVFEERLRGKAGIRNLEVNAYGRIVRELDIDGSVPGEDLELSIDADLQRFTANLIFDKGGVKRSGGSVVVMDVNTGEIITMASTPGFDSNIFVRGITQDEWVGLTTDPDKPMINKAVSTQYPPGSTFKVLVALAALESGVVTTATRHYCPGFWDYGGRRFHCWNERGHGQVSVYDALAQSCNVFFYKIAQDVGIDNISSMAKKFGLGSITGVEMPSEVPGLVPSKEWKKKTMGQEWYVGETINTSIGQGYMLLTPIQLAAFGAQVGNGGYKVKPTVLKIKPAQPVVNPDGTQTIPEPVRESLGLSQNALKIVQQGMDKVVNGAYGTASKSRITEKKYAMAGKTGTVQVRHRLEDQKAEVPRKFRNHALFVGYAPVDKPRFSIGVAIEHGGSGAFMAAPIAKDVLYEAQRLYDEKNKIS